MLHILLLIIKIIGIGLLIILGLIVVLLLLILIVPIRYHLIANYHDKPFGKVIVRWFGWMLYMKAEYIDEELSYDVRIFGYRIVTSNAKILEKRLLKKAKKEAKKDIKRSRKAISKTASKVKGHPVNETPSDSEEAIGDNTVESPVNDQVKEIGKSTKETTKETTKESLPKPESESAFISLLKKIWRFICNIPSFFKNIFHNIENILHNIKRIHLKYEDIRDYLLADDMKEAFNSVKIYVKKLLRHIAPNKMEGALEFGFDDPSLTGQLLGVLAVGLPLYKDKFHITPFFDQKVFFLELKAKGYIQTGYFVYIIIMALLNKNLMKKIKEMKHKIGGN